MRQCAFKVRYFCNPVRITASLVRSGCVLAASVIIGNILEANICTYQGWPDKS